MNMYYPIVFLIAVVVMSCSPQEANEVKNAQVNPTENYKQIVNDYKKNCHPIREQDTNAINYGGIAPESKQEFSTDRCFIPDENREKIIVYKNGLTIFDKKIEEIRLGTRLYVTVCNNRTLLTWGGVDPDDLGNLFDYEIYSLLNEQPFIDGGRSRERPFLNSKCQVNLP